MLGSIFDITSIVSKVGVVPFQTRNLNPANGNSRSSFPLPLWPRVSELTSPGTGTATANTRNEFGSLFIGTVRCTAAALTRLRLSPAREGHERSSDEIPDDGFGPTTHASSARRHGDLLRSGVSSLAAGLLVFALLAVAAPQAALSQASTVQVSNLKQQLSGHGPDSHDVAQLFDTGLNTHGYRLTFAEVWFHFPNGLPMVLPTYKMEVWSSDSGQLGTLVGELDPPDTVKHGVNRFVAPGAGFSLERNSSYFLLWDVDTRGSTTDGILRVTQNNQEDPGGAPNWSIANNARTRNFDSDGDFRNIGGGYSVNMAIKGYAKSASDTTPPKFTDASVDGTTLTLNYDEALDVIHAPGASDFTVTVDGTPANPTGVEVNQYNVQLTLTTAVVSAGQSVTVSYTPPSADANKLQDAAQQPAVALTNENVTIVDTKKPGLSTASVDGTSLTLTYDENLDESSVPAAGAFTVTVDGIDVSLGSPNPVVVSGATVVLKLAASVDSAGQIVRLNYTGGAIRDLGNNSADTFSGKDVSVVDDTKPAFSTASVNGTKLTLTYSEKLDESSEPGASAFAVTVDESAASLAASDPVNVSGDTVVLTLASAVVSGGQSVTVSYTVPGSNPIQDLADPAQTAEALLPAENVTEIKETTVPTITDAVVDGATLTLTYDEKLGRSSVPPDSAFRVTADGARVDLASAPVVATDTTVELTLSREIVSAGEEVLVSYTVPGSNPIQDRATPPNLASALDGHEASVVDTDAPSLSDAIVNGNSLTLTYDENLDDTSVPATTDFGVTVDGTTVNVTNVSITLRTVKLILATAVESAGQSVKVTYAVPSTNPIQDHAETPNEAAALTDQVVSIVDGMPPVFESARVNGRNLTVTFSEKLDKSSVPALSDFRVTVDETEYTPFNFGFPEIQVDFIILILPVAADVVSAGQTVTVSYNPGTNPIQDLANPPNPIIQFTRAVEVDDQSKPEFESASVEGTSLTLTYNEKLDETSVPAAEAFTVTVDSSAVNLATSDPVDISADTVVLTLAEAVVSAGQTVTVSYTEPSTNPIQDLATYPVVNTAESVTNKAVTVVDGTAPVLSDAKVDGTALTLTFDEKLDDTTPPAATAFTVTVGGSTVNLAATAPVAVSGSTVVLTLAEAVVSGGQSVTVSYTVPGSNPIQDTADPANEVESFADRTVSVVETTAPVFSSASLERAVLTLTYDETLDSNSVPAASAFTVTVGGNMVNLAATNPVAVSGSTVVLTLETAVESAGQAVTVSYSVPPANPIRDTAVTPNSAVALSDESVSVTESTDPALTNASVNGTTLTLTYDETLDSNSVPAATAFTVTVGGNTVSLAASNPVAVSGSTVVLTLAAAVESAGQAVAVSYSVPPANPIRDSAATPNNAASFSNQTVSVVETTAPTLSDASVDGTALTLTYNENLDESSVPAALAFTVTVDTNPVGLADTNPVAVSGSTVVLTLDAAVVSAGQEVRVTYTVPGTNPIRDKAATPNNAANLTNRAVSVVETTAPTLTGASVDGTALTLTYDEALNTTSVPAASAFTVTVDTNPVGLADTNPVAVSGSTVVLTLDAAVVSAGQEVRVTYTVPGTNPIRDTASPGNNAAALSDRSVSVTETTAPVLSSATVERTILTLTYDEKLDTSSQPSTAAFVVTVGGGTPANPSAVVVSDTTVVLTLANAVESAGVEVRLTYTVPPLNPIQDLANPPNTAAALPDQAVSVSESTAPVITNQSVDGTALTLTYNERLDESSVPDAGAFTVTVDGNSVSLAASDPVDVSGSTVVLTLAEAVVSAGQEVRVTYRVPSANPIRDTVANNAVAFANRVVTVSDSTAPGFSAATVEGTVLTLTYDEKLNTASVPDKSDFSVTVDSGTASNPSSVEVTGSTVVLMLATAVESADQTVTVSYTVPDTNPIQDLANPANSAAALTDRAVTVLDARGPSPTAASVEGTTLTLTFDETLDSSSEPAASAFRVTVDGGLFSLADNNPVDISADTVVLMLSAAVESAGQTVSVSYTVPDTNPIRDRSTNNAPSFANRTVAIVETTAPGLSGASVERAQLTLTFDERLDSNSEPAATAFTVTVDGSAASLATNNKPVAVSGSTVVLTLTTAVLSAGQTVTVSYTVPDTNPIQDLANPANSAAAFSDRSVTIVEDTPPTLISASVEGTTLTLTYNEPLDQASLPLESAFRVIVDGNAVGLATGSRPTVLINSVVLTLSEAVESAGQAVTVSYSVPSANPIRDRAENDAAAITDWAVTIVDERKPALSTATFDDIALTLTYDELLNTTSKPAPSAFTVTVDGSTVNLAATDPVAVIGYRVVLTLAEPTIATQTLTVDYSVPTANPIQDLADPANTAIGLTGQAVSYRLRSADASLSEFVVVDSEGENLALTPTFSPDVSSYTLALDGSMTSATVLAVVNDLAATLSGSLSRVGGAAEDLGMTSGTEAVLLELAAGENVLTVTVTAENGATRAYSLILIRAVSLGVEASKAWNARFGRAVAEHALDGISGRMRATRTVGFQGQLGGPVPTFTSASGRGDPVTRAYGPWSNRDTVAEEDHGTVLRQLLLGSSFSLTGELDSSGGNLAFWGRGAQTRFDGRGGAMNMDGKVTSGTLGVDYARGHWTVGLAVLNSRGVGGYIGKGPGGGDIKGEIESDLTATVPYGSWRASETLGIWGAAGIGYGGLTLNSEFGGAEKSNIGWTMLAAGLRSELMPPPDNGSSDIAGPTLALVSDAMWSRTKADGSESLEASSSKATRLRVGVEASWTLALEDGARFVPRLEVGARHDGGDVDVGTGLEVGGGISWINPSAGLLLEVEGRTLQTRSSDGRKESGLAASFVYDPNPATARGPSFSLRQSWGGQSGDGVDTLFEADSIPEHTGAGPAGGQWTAEVAYGFPAFGGDFTASPHVGFGRSATTSDYGLGWRVTPEGTGAPDVSFGLETTRSEAVNSEPKHRIGLDVTAHW